MKSNTARRVKQQEEASKHDQHMMTEKTAAGQLSGPLLSRDSMFQPSRFHVWVARWSDRIPYSTLRYSFHASSNLYMPDWNCKGQRDITRSAQLISSADLSVDLVIKVASYLSSVLV